MSSLKISDLGPPDPYDDYLLGGSTRSSGVQGELIVRRFEATELLSRIPPIVSWSDDPTYQIDQTVLRVNENLGQIRLNATSDVDATIDTVDRIVGELGEAERPAQPGPTLRQRIITALGPIKGLALSLSLGLSAPFGWDSESWASFVVDQHHEWDTVHPGLSIGALGRAIGIGKGANA